MQSRERVPDSAEGWRNVGVAFVATFVVFGIAYSFGAFLEPMATEFRAGTSATATVFSVTTFAYFMLGSITGRVADRYGPRLVLTVGAVALGTGLALTAQVDRLWLGYLTYGSGVGIAVACGYVPMLAVVGAWFDRRRGIALGIAVAGIGVGTLAVAPLAATLIARYGWRTTYLVFAVGGAVTLLGCALFCSAPPRAAADGPRRLGPVVRTSAFGALYVSVLLFTLALFVPLVFLPRFAEIHGATSVAGATLVGVIGIASVVGRLLLGGVADRIGPLRTYHACFAVTAVSLGIWLVGGSYSSLVLFAIVLGIGYGGFIALSPAVVAHLFGVHGFGALVGLLYTAAGFGGLVGPPLAGLIIDASDSFTWVIVGALASATAAFAVLLPLVSRAVGSRWGLTDPTGPV